MWRSRVQGGSLWFVYAGSNNQNFVMRDVQTGTWWQQVSGEALLGPLRGGALEPMPWEEVSFGIWRRENPDGQVLVPDPEHRAQYPFRRYRRPEAEQARNRPTPRWFRGEPELQMGAHDLVISVLGPAGPKAYPLRLLQQQNPIQDMVGDVPVLVVMAADGRSTRAYERRFAGDALQLYAVPDSDPLVLLEATTGSHFDFAGQGLDGPLAGVRLPRIQTVRDYWFDWRRYHPDGPVYLLQATPAR